MEKLLKMKADFETEKILHAKDTETMEQLQSEQKVLQDNFRSCILSMRRVTDDLKAKYEKKLEDIDKKVIKLEAKNEGMPKLLLKFKQMLEDSNQGRNQISINNKLIGGKIQLDNLLSNVVKESEEIKHLKTKLLVEKQNLDKLKNNIKQEKEILIKANELMSKEKLKLVLMKSDMQKQMITLKENQRMTKERYSDLKIRENEFRKNKTGLDRIAEKMKKEREQIHQLIMDVVTKRDEDNDNRFAMEQQNRDLSVLRQEHCEKSKEIAFARTKISTDMEKLLKMKADFETEKILHAKDTETMQQLQSEQKVLQDYFRSCILSIERVRDDLKPKYKKKLEDIDKKVVKLEAKNEGMPKLLLTIKHILENSNQGRDQISINNKLIVGGKIQLDTLLSNIVKGTAETKHLKTKLLVEKQNLDKLKNNIKQERAYLSKANMLMSKEKLELALMKSDMQKQLITLEENQHIIKEGNIDLEIRENELKNKTMGLDTIAEKMKKGREQIHQLNMDVGTKRDEVNDNRCAMEQQNKDLSVFRQEHCQKSKEIAFARTKISTGMEKLLKMKADFETEKILHAKDTETMEQLQSEQKVLQDHFRSCILSMRRETDDVKAKYEKKLEDIDKKVVKLEAKNEGMPKLLLEFKHMLEDSNQGRDRISINNKLIGGKIQLDNLLSNVLKESEEIKHLIKKLLEEKQNLDKLKNNIKQEEEILSKANEFMSKEKLELVLIRSDMQKQMIALKENQHMTKERYSDLKIRENEFRKNKTGLDRIAEKMKKEREQIHQLIMDVVTKRDEVNDNRFAMEQQNRDLSVLRQEHCQKSKEIAFARTKISTYMEKLLKIKADFETEKILHAKDTETMQQLQSKQKVLQDYFKSCTLSIERVRDDLKAKYKKKLEDIDKTVVKLEAKNEGMPKLLLTIKHMLENSNQGRDQISINNKLIVGGKIQLDTLLSNIVKETAETKHLKTKLLVEKQNLDKLKNNIKQERAYLSKANMLMSKEKLELVLMKSDMQKQLITLEENQRMIKEGNIDLEIRENELKKNAMGLDTITEKMKKGREQIHQLNMDVGTKRDEVNDNRCAMEQQNKDLSVLRQEHCQKTKEIAFARTKISTEMEKLLKMKATFETEKILHAKDTETMEQLQSEQEVLQDHFRSCILSMRRETDDVKAKYEKKLEDIDKKVVKLEAKNEGMPNLLLEFKHMLEDSNQGRDRISINNKLIGGKIQLDNLLSNVLKESEEIKHLIKKLLEEKQNLDKLKNNIKQEEEILSKANEFMSKEKLELVLIRSDMQKQMIALKENQRMTKERYSDLKIREKEFKKNKTGLNKIAEKMKKEREQIHQLNMDVVTKRDEVNDNRFAMEQQNRDLSVLRQEHCQKSKKIAFARTKISTDMEKLLKMKADFETERILHAKDTGTMQQLQSEQKVLQDYFKSCILSIERVRDDLKAKYKKKLEDIDKKVVKLEAKNEGLPKLLLTIKHMLENSNQDRDQISLNNKLIVGGKIQLDTLLSNIVKETAETKHLKTKLLVEKENLDKLKNNIKQEKEILSKANMLMSKEKRELALMKSDMQKQLITLEDNQRMIKEGNIDLEIRENELKKNTMGLDTLAEKMKKGREQIHQLNMDVGTKRDEVNDNRCAMEQQNKDLSVLRQEHCQRSKEIAFAKTKISTGMEKLLKMKATFETEKILHAKDTETMEQLQSEQKVLQDHFRSCILSMRRVADDLKAKYEKKLEDIDKKVVNLEAKNEGMPKLLLKFKHMLEDSNQDGDRISINNKLIVGGKIQLDNLLSNVVKESEELKHQKTKLLMEKQNLDELKNNIKQEEEILSKANELISKEKLELVLMKSDMQKQLITLKENQRMTKERYSDLKIRENEFIKNKTGLDGIAEKMKKERQQIHQLNMDVVTKRDEVNDNRCAMEQQNRDLSVLRQEHCQKSKEIAFSRTKKSTEMEKLLKMKADFATENILHAKDTETMEHLQSEQKVLQDYFKSCILSMQRVRDDLKAKYRKKLEDIDKRFVKLEAKNEGMPKLLLKFKHMLEDSNQDRDRISINNKLIVGGKIELDNLFSNVVKDSEEIKHLKTKLLVEKQNLDKLKNNIKQEKEILSKANELMSKEKLEVVLMKSDMQKQLITLGENQRMIKEGYIDFEIRQNEFKKNTTGLDTIAEKMKKGREQILQLNMGVGTKRDEVNDNKCAMEQQNRDLCVLRQEHCQKSKEIAFTRTKISTEMEKLFKMKAKFQTEKILHAKDTKRMEKLKSEQKVLQDHFRSCILSMERVGDVLKAKYKKKFEDIDKKCVILEAKNEGMPKILFELKHMMEDSNRGRDQISINNKLTMVGNLFSNVVKETEEIKHLKTKLLLEKQDLDKLKNNIKQEKEIMREIYRIMSKGKLELDLLESDMQKQVITLEDNQRITKERYIDLEIRENEFKKNKTGLDTLVEDMKKEKKNIYHLNMDVVTKRDEVNDNRCALDQKHKDFGVRRQEHCQKSKEIEGIPKLLLRIKHIMEDSNQGRDRISIHNKLIMGGRIQLDILLSSIVKETEEIKHLKTKLLVEKQNLDKLQNNIKQEKEILKQGKTTHLVLAKSNKAMKNELFEMKCRLEENKQHSDVTYQCMQSAKDNNFIVSRSVGVENELKQRLCTIPDLVIKRGVSPVTRISKSDCLRKIWKDIKTEKRNIDQMKCQGHEMKKNLEKQLHVINPIVKSYWKQKEYTFVKKKTLNQGVGDTSQSYSKTKDKREDEKCLDLQKLKIEMLSDIETLIVKQEHMTRALKTSDTATQTLQMAMTTDGYNIINEEQTKTGKTKLATNTFSGLLYRLQCYYNKCCCGNFRKPCAEDK
ncbi:uncharacterized protein [Nerophis lumbriciformis]|uniref:uncharacterized protein n=1 Tax=Nerophis lumbriciformis TaxID=546530 RepID=UPI003BAC39AF